MTPLPSLFRRRAPETADAADGPAPAPERLTFAVGDVHGRLDLLDALLEKMDHAADGAPHDKVFVGDYVDRGPESAGVLARLKALDEAQTGAAGIVCLMGNHDRMLADFLVDPEAGVRWLLNGGQETLTSYGIAQLQLTGGDGQNPVSARLAAQAEALGRAMGQDMIDWVEARPLWWRSGGLVAVHAHTDPALPMEAQSEEVLLWARPRTRQEPREDGTWVVHGHTIVQAPTVSGRHVNVDTGAVTGGPLTAAVFAPGEPPRFLHAFGD